MQASRRINNIGKHAKLCNNGTRGMKSDSFNGGKDGEHIGGWFGGGIQNVCDTGRFFSSGVIPFDRV